MVILFACGFQGPVAKLCYATVGADPGVCLTNYKKIESMNEKG